VEFAFDIETIPNKDVIDKLPEPEVKYGNTKDPEKQKAMKEKAKLKQLENMALDPYFARICSFAIHAGTYSKVRVLKEVSDEAEVELIQEAFEVFTRTDTYNPTVIIWAGKDHFDIRFLYIRAIVLGIEKPIGMPVFEELVKKKSMFVNLMQVVCEWGKFLKLGTASRIILDEDKIEHDFSKFIELIESGRGKEIGKYNLQDAKLTYNLYKKIKPYFLEMY
jgi:predicted PolB exonuclease-like 3'-5' exonuclease